jgi:Transcriptional Coactivator p15 (PC4)
VPRNLKRDGYAKIAYRDDTGTETWLAVMAGGPMLIGKLDVRTGQKILVTIQEIKKIRMIDVRVYQTSGDGEMVATPAGVSLSPDQVEQVIELLKEAKRKAA